MEHPSEAAGLFLLVRPLILLGLPQWLEAHPRVQGLIEGHCDERGTERYNLALGDRRAYEAKEYLTVLGVNGDELRTISYGKEKPFDDGHDESAWSKNRRAHIVLTAIR